jgi:uncharacterized protein (DUF1697 family)
MSAVIALLRAVNVGGRTVKAAQLKAAATGLGHTDVVTYVNSGNLVLVPGAGESPAAVARGLSDALAAELGFDVPVIARSADEWDELVDAVPFREEAAADPAHLVLVCFDGRVGGAARDFDASAFGNEQVVWGSSDAYAWYPDGIGRSKLTLDRLSRAAGRAGTARNWRTVLALADLARERSSRG